VQRAVEFRRLCEILRNHIQSQTKNDPKWKDKEPLTPEAMQTHLETRFSQLSTAIDMALWQEVRCARSRRSAAAHRRRAAAKGRSDGPR
jgi:hypothetical protein